MPELIDQPKMNEPVIFTHCFTPASHFYLKKNIVWILLFINFIVLSCSKIQQEGSIYFHIAKAEPKFHSPLCMHYVMVSLLTSLSLLLIDIVV